MQLYDVEINVCRCGIPRSLAWKNCDLKLSLWQEQTNLNTLESIHCTYYIFRTSSLSYRNAFTCNPFSYEIISYIFNSIKIHVVYDRSVSSYMYIYKPKSVIFTDLQFIHLYTFCSLYRWMMEIGLHNMKLIIVNKKLHTDFSAVHKNPAIWLCVSLLWLKPVDINSTCDTKLWRHQSSYILVLDVRRSFKLQHYNISFIKGCKSKVD